MTTLPSPPEFSLTFQASLCSEIADSLLYTCAELFSTNYGVWGTRASTVSRFMKHGNAVKMNSRKLREQCVPVPDKTVLVTCFRHTQLLGHALATVWEYDGGVVGWITQLVVDRSVRRRYIATHLLQTLKIHPLFSNITAIGIASSHPASCNALAKYTGLRIGSIDLDFIKSHAPKILNSTTVRYLKNAPLRGSLFEPDPDPGVISSIYTEFFVDHQEPLAVLATYEEAGKWCLGKLLEGHEYLLLVRVSDGL